MLDNVNHFKFKWDQVSDQLFTQTRITKCASCSQALKVRGLLPHPEAESDPLSPSVGLWE